MNKLLKILLKLFLFILPWQTIWIYQENFFGDYKNQFTTLGFYLSEILLWFIIILFITWYWRKYKAESKKLKDFYLSKDRLFVLSILIFLFYCFVSSFWALNFSVAWQQALHIMEMFLLFFILFLGPLNKKEIYQWIILGSILPIILGLCQFVLQITFSNKYLGLSIHPVWEAGSSVVVGNFGRLLRAYGSFSHPNIFGGYLFLVLVTSFLFFTDKKTNFLIKYLFISVLLLTMFFTFSRSALLATMFFILSLSVYYFFKKNYFNFKLGIFSLLLFVGLLFSLWPIWQSRFSGGSINEVQSIEERIDSITQSLELWSQNKFFGVGVGNYTNALYNKYPNFSGWLYQPVHNVFLLFLAEIGFVGYLLIFYLIISFVFYFKSVKLSKDNFWLIYLSFCFLLLSIFDHYLYTSYTGLMFISLLFWLISAKK